MLLAGCQVRTDPYGRTVLSTPTLGRALGLASQPGMQPGLLHVTRAAATGAVQDQRVIEGHTVRIMAQGNGHQIVVDGRVLANDAEDDRVLIQDVYRGGGKTYVLIGEQSGGNACPSLYQAIDLIPAMPALQVGSEPVVSPRFGNCSDVPKVSVVGGALRVSVPAFRAAPAATYVFRDGRLSH